MPSINGAVDGNSQNIPAAHTPRNRSTFPLHYHLFNTHRFGEYIPHYVEDVVKDDNLPIHSSSVLRSYTLKSPVMQSLKRRKDYFAIPMEAILPNNWEKFFEVPARGADVDDKVGTSVAGFWSRVAVAMNGLYTAMLGELDQNDDAYSLQVFLRFILTAEMFYSSGSLLSSLGCHGLPYVTVIDDNSEFRSYDELFDFAISQVLYKVMESVDSFTFKVDGFTYEVFEGAAPNIAYPSISIHHALQLMRDNLNFEITSYTNVSGIYIASLVNTVFSDWSFTAKNGDFPIDLRRVWAYQLSCAHYFTNDHVDYIYNANLYRQLIGSYIGNIINSAGDTYTTIMEFSFNGTHYLYDWMSGRLFDYVLGNIISYPEDYLGLTNGIGANLCGYISACLAYRRSLRYLDYFTGSRPTPLAVVNTNVAVNAGQVSVIDITKGIAAQRLGNAVNRVRHNFENYMKGIFGGSLPAPDYHNPFYVARTEDTVFGQETDNTGTDQLTKQVSITTSLRSNSGNYVFNFNFDRPAVIIGITSYDIPRIYTKGIERSFIKSNRFDEFNPFMQYVGDQQIYLQELGISPYGNALSTLKNFSYTLRHMEYKQRFNQAAGGFCVPSTNLHNWIFVAKDRRGNQASINPDWIRSVNAELDDFYVSLSGYSLGTYFHFIVDDFNSCKASRPMAYSPQIL